jgi:hypothetical protein
MWSFLIVLAGLSFPALAVWVRRRFDTEEMIAASAGAIVLQGALVVIAGWNRDDFPSAPMFVGMALGTIAAACAVERMVARSTTPAPGFEAAAGFVAFVVGSIVGFYIGFLFSLRGGAWVG